MDLTYVVEATDNLASGSWSEVSLPAEIEPVYADLERVTLREASFPSISRRF